MITGTKRYDGLCYAEIKRALAESIDKKQHNNTTPNRSAAAQ